MDPSNATHIQTLLSQVQYKYLAQLSILFQATIPPVSNITFTEICSTPMLAKVIYANETSKIPAKLLHELKGLYALSFGKDTRPEDVPAVMAAMDHEFDRPKLQYYCFGITSFFMLLFVGLRLFTRYWIVKRLYWSDYLLLFSVTSVMGYIAILLWGVIATGGGLHIWDVTFHMLQQDLKCVYISQIYYFINLVPVKLSVLALYYEIFPQNWVRKSCWILGVAIIVMTIPFTVSFVFVCTPMRWWNDPINMKCIDRLAALRASSICSILTDVAILVLPLCVVLKLQMRTRKKLAVAFLFGLGAVAVLASILRMFCLEDFVKNHDYTYVDQACAEWTIIESEIAIICAALPTLRPLFTRVAPSIREYFNRVSTMGRSFVSTVTLPSQNTSGNASDRKKSTEKSPYDTSILHTSEEMSVTATQSDDLEASRSSERIVTQSEVVTLRK